MAPLQVSTVIISKPGEFASNAIAFLPNKETVETIETSSDGMSPILYVLFTRCVVNDK